MKKEELRTLVETNHDDIIKAMREADREAYKCTSCRYTVALYPDGHTEIRERLSGDNWWYVNDPAVLEVGSFCHEYYDVLRDNLSSGELLDFLESEMGPDEAEKYHAWRVEYEEKECEAPEDWDAVDWIEEHLFFLWDRVEGKAIEELLTNQETEIGYEEKIDYAIDAYFECVAE